MKNKITTILILASIMIIPHVSRAAGAPIVLMGAATNIYTNSATLNGSVNPNGSLTAAKFVYGSDQFNLDQTIQLANLNGGYSASPVTTIIAGLAANTTYAFQIIASNASGVSLGNILFFTTPSSGSGPPTNASCSPVCTYPANEVTDTSAQIWGYGIPDTTYPTTAYFRISRMTSPPVFCNDIYGTNKLSTDDISLSTPSSFSKTLTGLAPDTTYYYCAVISTKKAITYGNNNVVMSFTTKPCATCAQSSIQTKPVSSVTKTSAVFNGYFNTTVSATTWFEYAKTFAAVSGGNGTVVGSVNQYGGSWGPISFLAPNLSQNTNYYYRAAIKQGGNTTYGTSITHFKTKSTVDTNPCDPSVPYNPWNVSSITSQNATAKTAGGSIPAYGGQFGPSITGNATPSGGSGTYDGNGDPCGEQPPPRPGFFPSGPSGPSFPAGPSGPTGPVPAIAPDDAIVRFREGVENVFARQIIKNPAIATLFGYQAGNDLNQYAYYLAHLLAQFFGYVEDGHEIRVSLPDVAAYELKLTNGVLMINEYFAGFLISSRQVSPFKAPPSGYEYQFKKY